MNKTKHIDGSLLDMDRKFPHSHSLRGMLAVPGIFISFIERLDTEFGIAGALSNAPQKIVWCQVCVSGKISNDSLVVVVQKENITRVLRACKYQIGWFGTQQTASSIQGRKRTNENTKPFYCVDHDPYGTTGRSPRCTGSNPSWILLLVACDLLWDGTFEEEPDEGLFISEVVPITVPTTSPPIRHHDDSPPSSSFSS